MHDGTPANPPFDPALQGPTLHAPTSPSNVDGIVDGALSATAAAPPPASRSARRRQERIERAHAKAMTPRPGSRGRSGGSGASMGSATTMVLWALLALVGLGAVAFMSGAIDMDGPGSGVALGDPDVGSDRDGSWSYYHDRDYDSSVDGAKWSTDRTRSSDPAEAALGNTTRWEYDGPYRYGPYGSDAMRRRAQGRESADPLYSQPTPLQDVFSRYSDTDPSGGQPVGVAPSSMTNPHYDPYGGYSNPYANRIRLAYGEGVGRGASYDPLG